MVGPTNGVNKAVLGTVTQTKAGTSNYVLSADYSPVGASGYIVRAYLYGVLVAQTTNPSGSSLAVLNNLSLAAGTMLGDGTGRINRVRLFSALIGTTSVTCDEIDVTPENPQAPIAPTAFQIVASQIPSITITSENESIVYQGLTNTSLGQASFEVISNLGSSGQDGVTLIVSNLTSSGQDGVTIALPTNLLALDVQYQDVDPSNALPVGAYVQSSMIGTFGTVTNGILAADRMTKAGISNYAVHVDFSPLGVSNCLVQAYLNGILVGQGTTNTPSAIIRILSIDPDGTSWDREWDDDGCYVCDTMDCVQSEVMQLPGGQIVSANKVYFIPSNLGTCVKPTAFQITASQVPDLAIASENLSLPYAGLTNTSLGQASIEVISNLSSGGQDGSALVISNLGSAGQDGVSITLPGGLTNLDVGWNELDPSNTLPVGAYIQSQIVGTDGGITNGVLGTLTETKAGTSNYVLSADFSPVGASTYTVQAYYQGAPVAEATHQSGASLAVAQRMADTTDTVVGPNGSAPASMDDSVATSASIAGQIVTCDNLEVTPENVTFSNAPAALQIVSSQVSSFTITSVGVSPLLLNVSQTSQNILLQWYGTSMLQESTDLRTWIGDTNVTSPYAAASKGGGTTQAPAKFYRLIFRP
ncbi:MAG TPA: hypothetical protein VN784_04160 [Candidatus Limnocylindrales bacterium]|nr:hypothetical protein [Candidatus Limnocylindrales bacterium]